MRCWVASNETYRVKNVNDFDEIRAPLAPMIKIVGIRLSTYLPTYLLIDIIWPPRRTNLATRASRQFRSVV